MLRLKVCANGQIHDTIPGTGETLYQEQASLKWSKMGWEMAESQRKTRNWQWGQVLEGWTALLPVVMGTLLSHQGQPELRGNFQPAERKLVEGGALLFHYTWLSWVEHPGRGRVEDESPVASGMTETGDRRAGSWLTSLLFYLLVIFELQHLWGGFKYNCLFMQQLVIDGKHAPDVGLWASSEEENVEPHIIRSYFRRQNTRQKRYLSATNPACGSCLGLP